MQNNQAPLPPLNWLKTFAAAARLLNFTAAANELNMTQSAVSQQVRLLEDKLGRQLFNRQHKKLTLTNSGMAYLPAVQEALELVQRATHDIFSPLKYGVLTLQVNTAFLLLWLTPRLPDFNRLHPGIELRLSSINWDNEYSGMSTDLTIRHGRGNWPDHSTYCLVTPKLRPFATPDLAATLNKPEDLLDIALIDVLGNHQQWDDWLHSAGVQANLSGIRHQVDTAAAAVSLAKYGGGVCLGYDELLSQEVADKQLIPVFSHYVDTVDSYYLGYNQNRPLTQAAQLFKDWLCGQLDYTQATVLASRNSSKPNTPPSRPLPDCL